LRWKSPAAARRLANSTAAITEKWPRAIMVQVLVD
jgi:hypothetical protein